MGYRTLREIADLRGVTNANANHILKGGQQSQSALSQLFSLCMKRHATDETSCSKGNMPQMQEKRPFQWLSACQRSQLL